MGRGEELEAGREFADAPWMTELVVAAGGAPTARTTATLPAARIQFATMYTITGWVTALSVTPRSRLDGALTTPRPDSTPTSDSCTPASGAFGYSQAQ